MRTKRHKLPWLTRISVFAEYEVERRTVAGLEMTGCDVELIIARCITFLIDAPRNVNREIFLQDVVIPTPLLIKCVVRQRLNLLWRSKAKPLQTLDNPVRVWVTELLQHLVAGEHKFPRVPTV